jgi:predicted enzyme related to lactoylglutathione lyase
MAQTAQAEIRDDGCSEAGNAARWSHGSFFWNELMTRDPETARKFYADTVGWTFDAMPMADGGTYWVAKVGDKPVGGIFEMKGPGFDGVPENWMPYLAVDDIDSRAKKAVAAGASLMRPLFDIPGIGRIAILKEPGGAAIGWITPQAS